MNLKNIKYFELTKLDCSINYARIKAARYKQKTGQSIKIKSIKGQPYAYRDILDLKEVDHNTMYTLIDQLKNSLEKIKIFESDEDIL